MTGIPKSPKEGISLSGECLAKTLAGQAGITRRHMPLARAISPKAVDFHFKSVCDIAGALWFRPQMSHGAQEPFLSGSEPVKMEFIVIYRYL